MKFGDLFLVAKFISVGLVNTIFGLTVIFLCMSYFKFNPLIANFIGYLLGFILGFFLNKEWTFQSKRSNMQLIFSYLIVIIFAYLINLMIVYLSINYFLIDYYLAQTIGVLSYTLISFFGFRKFVFK